MKPWQLQFHCLQTTSTRNLGKCFRNRENWKSSKYHTKLSLGVQLFVLFTSRKVYTSLLKGKVSEELWPMENMGVIWHVDVPTPWLAGMAIAPINLGLVRMCWHQTTQSECTPKSAPFPNVVETLAQLADRCRAVQQIWCQQRILANTSFTNSGPTDYCHFIIWYILL